MTTTSQSESTTARHEEHQYLDLIRRVLDTGATRPDRTGTGTLSLFAPPSLRFSLTDDILPLLTTKRTFLRGIIEELLWFVAGSTDSTILSNRGVKIWDGNGSKEFLQKRGLGHRREGDLGPVYGFQWRHFGALYVDCDASYDGQGVDQLRECIRKIKEDPTDRRIILSAWNPAGTRSKSVMRRVFYFLTRSQTYLRWHYRPAIFFANSTCTYLPLLSPTLNRGYLVSCFNAQQIWDSGSRSISRRTPSSHA
jgi:hypothetical protein